MMGGIISGTGDVLALAVLFGITIFVHELGHYLVARWCGLVIDTFSIGFGPSIWKRKIGGTVYKIGWIPFGGYVALPQLDPAGMDAIQGKPESAAAESEPAKDAALETPASLPPIAPWKKILVSLAGVTGNMLFALVLAYTIYLLPQSEVGGKDTLIGHVSEDSAAYEAGLRAGDRIVAVGGERVADWHDYVVLTVLHGSSNTVALTVLREDKERTLHVPTEEQEMGIRLVSGVGESSDVLIRAVAQGQPAEQAGVQAGDVVLQFAGIPIAGTGHFIALVDQHGGRATPLVVLRDGEPVDLVVTPVYREEYDRSLMGVEIASMETVVMPWMRHRDPWKQVKGDADGILRVLRALVTPRESRQAARGLGGPVLILATLWVSIQASFLSAVGFIRFLNVNLAILNLLPIPVLDGGHIVFALIEWISRRRVHPKVMSTLVNMFAALLIAVIVLLTLRDSPRAFRMVRGIWDARNAEAPVAAHEDAETDTDAVGSDVQGDLP